MRLRIVEKLYIFLKSRRNFKEESEVVYLMIELRKILDREREEKVNNKDSLVRFYADWMVHTSKNHITTTIALVMKRIDSMLTPYPRNGNLSFLLIPELKYELIALFKRYGLPDHLIKNDNEWKIFIWLITQVLADQPLVNPTHSISKFYFSEAGKRYIGATINFNDHRGSIDLGGHIDTL